MKLSPINNCANKANITCNYGRIQVNNEYMTQNNIWYREDDDFTMNERTGSYSANTEDSTPSGSARVRSKITNFEETKDWTFTEDMNSALLKMLHQVQMQSDEYIKDFMQCGLNYEKITCFEDGAITIQRYTGLTTTSMDKVFEQMDGADNEISWSLTAGNEPEYIMIGFSAELPQGIEELSATVTASYVDPDLTVSISNIVDNDNLLIPTVPTGKEFKVDVWDADYNLITQFTGETPTDLVFSGLEVGKYKIATAYHYFTDSSNVDYYRYIDIQEIEVV